MRPANRQQIWHETSTAIVIARLALLYLCERRAHMVEECRVHIVTTRFR